MRAQDPDDEMVTIRVPRRAVELMNANLEIGSSRTFMRAQAAFMCFILAVFFVVGLLIASRALLSDDSGSSQAFDIILGVAFCVVSALLIGIVLLYRAKYRSRGLV